MNGARVITTGGAVLDQSQQETFTAFAAQNMRPLFGTALLLTGDWHLAEDLVQETLVQLYRAWPRDIASPAAYARTSLVNTFLSHRRRRSSGEVPSAFLPDQAVATSDVDLRRTVLDALLTLSKRDRTVVVLRYLADRSVDEVASDLGRSPGAIRAQASRALAKLRAALADTDAQLLNT